MNDDTTDARKPTTDATGTPAVSSEDIAARIYDGFARYGSGVTLISVRDPDRDLFFVAASVLTASVSPFTLAVSVGNNRAALPAMTAGVTWSLSVLGEHHRSLAQDLTTATKSLRLDALKAAGAKRSEMGPLWLPDAIVTLWCRTRTVTPVHDQAIVIGEVLLASQPTRERPLLRWNHDYRLLNDLPVS